MGGFVPVTDKPDLSIESIYCKQKNSGTADQLRT